MKRFYKEEIAVAVLLVLDRGDQDDQPWAFYAHDHGGLKGHQWTEADAEAERLNFIKALITEMETGLEEPSRQ